MKSFKTKAGTVLPILELKGKDYLQVAYRIQWFREEKPEWVIKSSFTRLDDTIAICEAQVLDDKQILRAMAHKREDLKHFPDYMEKAETGAIGRALAMLGYGTQFTADEFDEGERLADSPIQKGDKRGYFDNSCFEPAPEDGDPNALIHLEYKIPFGKFKQRSLEEVGVDELRKYVNYIEAKAQKDGKQIVGQAKEFIERASEYIVSFENHPINQE